MTSAQGKGKKKNKDVMKLSLDEFNQIDAPHGHSVVSLKVTGLDWAATMADYDMKSVETQQIIVPAAPRAQRGPGVDFESLPVDPPFRVSLFNVGVGVEEKDIADRFLNGIDVIRVEILKTTTTVELASRNDMYEALCKDGVSFKGRTVNVCLYGQTPVNSYGQDRYGGRGSNSSYGDRSYQREGGYGAGGQRTGDKYGDRFGDRPSGGSGGYNRDRDNYTGYNRGGGGGFGSSRGGYGQERYNPENRLGNFRDSGRGQYNAGEGEPEREEPENWRARPAVKPAPPTTTSPTTSYNNGSRQSYMHSRSDSTQQHYHNQPPHHQSPPHQQYHQSDSYYQPRYQNHNNPPHRHHPHQQPHHNAPPNNSPYSQDNQAENRPASSSTSDERPRLILQKRKAPLNVDDPSESARNEAIFGKAKPSSTPYQKMNEIEEKLSSVKIE